MSCGAAGWTAQPACCRRRHCRRVTAVAGRRVCAYPIGHSSSSLSPPLPLLLADRAACTVCCCHMPSTAHDSEVCEPQHATTALLCCFYDIFSRLHCTAHEATPALMLQGRGCRAEVVAESCALPDGGSSTLARQLLFSVYTHVHPMYSEFPARARGDWCCSVLWRAGEAC